MQQSGIYERDELAVVLRLYHDLRDGRRDDERPSVVYLSRLIGVETSAVQEAMASFSLVDPRRRGLRPGAPPAAIVALWQEVGEDRVQARRQAEISESVLWKKHGRDRMDFESWTVELLRICDHEGGPHRTAKKEDARRAFEAGSSPWSFYDAELSTVKEASIDDIPVLGEDD